MTIEKACKELENFPWYTLKEPQEIAIKTLIDFAKRASDKKIDNGIDVDEKVEEFSKLLNNSLINEAIAND